MLRFDDGGAEELLGRASTDLRAAALKAKKRAFTFRRDQYLVFSRSGFLLTERPPRTDGFGPQVDDLGIHLLEALVTPAFLWTGGAGRPLHVFRAPSWRARCRGR